MFFSQQHITIAFWLLQAAVAQVPSLPQDPRITTPTGSRSYCYGVIDMQLACQTLTPNWTTLAPSDQASCYCYDASGSYVPSIYDNAASKCWIG
ncbi:hypothetical protein BAUCODRAFT_35622 [Baudoinia panamericana UAMH 10762]|uniref:Uncharacterized protein n=1 Tax=Baudoinia panamericana (strain UAMH 10762) TaxID=717646 RepID=M2N6J7_BAUPA|nr:uncharacterized protein BAUCODRAFT_35622 [Baudoinia panamericana UAMH 10762]EMC94400.1 hypothetical protein BAUCODRAFT_35622 [Baudoinia panamericana UAMH 10762]